MYDCRRLTYASASDILTSTLTGSGIHGAMPAKVSGAIGVAVVGNDSICWAKTGKNIIHCISERGIVRISLEYFPSCPPP